MRYVLRSDKPRVIQAFRFIRGMQASDLPAWITSNEIKVETDAMWITTPEGRKTTVFEGKWILLTEGGFSTCTDWQFQDFYKPVDPVVTVTDEMVERAAFALEKKQCQDGMGWTDEQFDIWWNRDPSFMEHNKGWGWFSGTQREKALYEARIVLEAVLS